MDFAKAQRSVAARKQTVVLSLLDKYVGKIPGVFSLLVLRLGDSQHARVVTS